MPSSNSLMARTRASCSAAEAGWVRCAGTLPYSDCVCVFKGMCVWRRGRRGGGEEGREGEGGERYDVRLGLCNPRAKKKSVH